MLRHIRALTETKVNSMHDAWAFPLKMKIVDENLEDLIVGISLVLNSNVKNAGKLLFNNQLISC